MWEGVGDRTELQHIDPYSIGHNRVSFPFSWAAQPRAWGPSLSGTCSSIQHLLSNTSDHQLICSPTETAQSGAWGPTRLGVGFLYRILPPTDWISCALSNIIVQRPPSSCGRHNFALIQPVHSQGYNILIFLDRMHLLFTQVNFLFWQTGRVVGQYTTHIYVYACVCICVMRALVPFYLWMNRCVNGWLKNAIKFNKFLFFKLS